MEHERRADCRGDERNGARVSVRTKITHVAIRFHGVTYSLPAPNRHHNVSALLFDQVKHPDRVRADRLFSEDVW
jgi:hypothetical protein